VFIVVETTSTVQPLQCHENVRIAQKGGVGRRRFLS
jgi:hypothetical protein